VEYHGEREIRGWKQPRNPPMSTSGVSVAIVLGTRESRVHGERPQLIGSLVATLLDGKAWESWPMPAEREMGCKSNRRGPCAVKVACTVPTGGWKNTVRLCVLSLRPRVLYRRDVGNTPPPLFSRPQGRKLLGLTHRRVCDTLEAFDHS
jgi:hypothetical protein